MRYFAPVFEREQDRFIVVLDPYIGMDEQDAMEIGLAASIAECLWWGALFTHSVVDVTDGVVGEDGYLGDIPIVIVSGPSYEESVKDDKMM